MKYGSLILEKKEYVYLKRILNISGYAENFETQKSLQRLTDEIKTAHIVDEDEVPDDVIRINSKVRVISGNGWEKTVQVVMPMDKDLKQNKISILTPMGAALIGYSKNDIIIWDFPGGKQQLQIVDVDQEKHIVISI
ncbi:GreA/GreB family elongation factor [Flavivirga sp. 57AJ16]|uniref:GreA/GreB family elongation factor n=1 Tax=Flavivirga sp. 57AJ16 TaxID=3025307 RepID=UPI002366A243|nr:GreA/GreB family elongation factor [Flavivirga sp. 57AJ16]MDD7886776.1 GreA/GreB family elongation factor [Flavivirga sp. 57AJ16]